MTPQPPPADGPIELARILVLLQGAFLVLATIEASVIGLGTSIVTLAPIIALTAASATAALVLSARLRKRGRRARRLVIAAEIAVLLLALVDLALAIGLGHRSLPLMSILTRVVLPIVVIRLLRRPSVRLAFAPQGVAA